MPWLNGSGVIGVIGVAILACYPKGAKALGESLSHSGPASKVDKIGYWIMAVMAILILLVLLTLSVTDPRWD